MRSLLLSVLLAMAFVTTLPRAARADDEVVAHLAADTGIPYSYAEYLPPGYDTEADDVFHPLVVFLHGAGEKAPRAADGATIIRQCSVHGPLGQISRGERRYADASAIVLAPNCPNEDGWWGDTQIRAFFTYIVAHYRVDWRRVYVTGVSMGGGGTFMVGNYYGSRAAAYIPICPAGTANGARYTDTPLWGFHSVGDGTVTIDNTWTSFDRMADARAGRDVDGPRASYPADGEDHTAIFDTAAGTFSWTDGRDSSGSSPLRVTVYPDGSHNSWTRSYDDPAVWTWLFAQRRAIPDGLPEETIFVDALHPGVTLAGTWTRQEDRSGFFFWDLASATAAEGTEAIFPLRAREDGMHEIYLRHVAVPGATRVAIEIAHEDGEENVEVDLSMGGGVFTSLGTFPLRAGGDSTFTLRGASGATGTIVADAIAIVRRGALPTPDAGPVEADAGSTTSDGGTTPIDGGVGSDASGRDAGARGDGGPASQMLVGGCACTATGASAPMPAMGWLGLVGVATIVARRRRR